MLGGGDSGVMHVRGRISVIPGGHCSPGLIGVPRPPMPPPRGGPPAGGCAATTVANVTSERAETSTRRIGGPRVMTVGCAAIWGAYQGPETLATRPLERCR